MPTRSHTALLLALACAILPLTAACAQPTGETVDLPIASAIDVQPGDSTSQAIVAAATAFLRTLSAAQRDAVVYAFDDNDQRARWSNLPVSFVQRGGIMRGDLNEAQGAALDRLLEQVLSEAGVRNARLQMAADDTLVRRDGIGPRVDFGSAFYYVAFLGEPSNDAPWMLQFGGHHLAINVTFAGPQASFSPMLTGGQPMNFEYLGETVHIAQAEIAAARALMTSLTVEQRTAAIRGAQPIRLLLGPGAYGATLAPEGVRGADLSAAQKDLLLAVVAARVGHFNARDATATMDTVRAHIDDTYFGWWGPVGEQDAAYWRITGPEIVMEFSPQRMGNGAPGEHIHSMYRDPTNDYGAAWVGARP